MSIDKVAAKGRIPRTETGEKTVQSVIERIDVAALQIDEMNDINCDPYNSTGQFLIEAIKAKAQ